MAKSPNIDPFNGYSTQWTQPYVTTNAFYIQTRTPLEQEIDRLDTLEQEIQTMSSYPDAERIINKITKEIKDD